MHTAGRTEVAGDSLRYSWPGVYFEAASWPTSEFGGFVAAPGGAIIGRPAARHRQVDFVGDSFTAGSTG